MARQGYYRIEKLPLQVPLDADGDGRDDVVELRRQPTFSALNPALPMDVEDGAVFLPDRATYELLAHRDDFPGAVGVREVKFLVSEVDGPRPKLHFLNTRTRRYHFDFARSVLGFARDRDYWDGLSLFNEITYFTNTRRRFLAGSLVYHPHVTRPGRAPGLYAVEFWPAGFPPLCRIVTRPLVFPVEPCSARTPCRSESTTSIAFWEAVSAPAPVIAPAS